MEGDREGERKESVYAEQHPKDNQPKTMGVKPERELISHVLHLKLLVDSTHVMSHTMYGIIYR